jgi:hypothetical protein
MSNSRVVGISEKEVRARLYAHASKKGAQRSDRAAAREVTA